MWVHPIQRCGQKYTPAYAMGPFASARADAFPLAPPSDDQLPPEGPPSLMGRTSCCHSEGGKAPLFPKFVSVCQVR